MGGPGTAGAADRASAPGKPPSVETVVRRVVDVSTLPQVALRVLEVARDPRAGVQELKAVVEGDPALSARVLRLVNSAAYGVKCRITNLQQAIGFLGFSQIRNLALTASVSQLFRQEQQLGPYRRSQLWRHLVATALCARLVAIRSRAADFEDAFLAGLLHDLGIILADQHVHAHFRLLMSRLRPGTRLTDAEQQIFGWDHTQLGERLAQEWRFPANVRAAMRHHHNSMAYSGEGEEVVRCVEAANVITTLKDITSVGLRLVTPSPGVFRALGFSRTDVLVLAEDLDREMAQNETMLELEP